MGEAFIAAADDPSSIFYNPAGISQVDRPTLSAGVYVLQFDTEFQGAGGKDRHREVYALPHFFLAAPISERATTGIGIYNSYGLGVNWSGDGPLASTVDNAELSVLTVSPTLAFELSPTIRVGVSANLYAGALDRALIATVPALGRTEARFDVSDVAFGLSAGVQWDLDERQAIGALVRTPTELRFKGDVDVEAPAAGVDTTNDARFDIPLPFVLGAGYTRRLGDTTRLNTDLIWTEWSSLDSVSIETSDPVISSLPPEQFNYGNAISARVGIESQLTDRLTARAGYGYFSSIGADDAFSPLVPDLNAHLLSSGVGIDLGNGRRLDVAYQLIAREERTIRGSSNSPDGSYQDTTHAVMVTINIPF